MRYSREFLGHNFVFSLCTLECKKKQDSSTIAERPRCRVRCSFRQK